MNTHNPSNLKAEEYTYLGITYSGPSNNEELLRFYDPESEALDQSIREALNLKDEWIDFTDLVQGMNSDPEDFDRSHEPNRCVCCNKAIRHILIFNHITDGLIAVGRSCGWHFDNTDQASHKIALIIKAAAKAKKVSAALAKWNDFHAQHEGLTEALTYDHSIINDINSKGTKYGSISAKQIELVKKIAATEEAKAAHKAERAADTNAQPVPATTDRINFTGTIVNEWMKEDLYTGGEKHMMKFLDDRGFELLGTVPSKLSTLKAGDKITFDATVTVSNKDPKFGFFKRPTKAVSL